MTDENTPLTSTLSHGPDEVFPGGVSPHYRRNKMMKLQYCVCATFMGILLASLILALIYGNIWSPTSSLFLTAGSGGNSTQNTPFINLQQKLPANATIPDENETTWALKELQLNNSDHEAAVNVGIQVLGDKEILEENSETTPIDTPAFRHYRSLSTYLEARKLARSGFVENYATLHIAGAFNYTKKPGRNNIGRGPQILMPHPPPANFTCDFNNRYRSANGLCNNKLHTSFGAALIAYRRMVAPDYADGVSLPRASHSGEPLPTARQVSLKIHRSSYATDSNFTVMLAVFGQFLDHDITATSLSASEAGESINCCTVPPNEHPECFAVPLESDDPYYQRFGMTCMNFVRSAAAPTGHFGPRQQLNQATAFIDGSVVYGNTDQLQKHLRTLTNGTLRMYETEDGRQLLPISSNLDDGCNRKRMNSIGRYCFESGDDRANENLLLTSIHLLFARHHNYLARGLQQINPQWNDETIFQEARKILAAQIAHIAYNEFLPILLGSDLAENKGLLPSMEDLDAPDTYDPSLDPSIANCFASAAFRFAHTLLPGLLNLTRDNQTTESIELHKMLFNPFSLWPKRGVDYAIESAMNTPVLRVDLSFTPEVTEKLFESVSDDGVPFCGLDLVSLNIQRGRDHGLPSYPVFRNHCRLSKVDTWDEMAAAVDPSSLEAIKKIYATPSDVDVYTGALSELPLKGAIFGPLLTCLVSDQFMRLKYGDSHWYERKMGPSKFSKDQLHEIYKTTLSQIICRNADDLEEVPKYVMKHRGSEVVECKQLEAFNFTAWLADGQASKLHRTAIAAPWKKVRVIHKEAGNSSVKPLTNITQSA